MGFLKNNILWKDYITNDSVLSLNRILKKKTRISKAIHIKSLFTLITVKIL